MRIPLAALLLLVACQDRDDTLTGHADGTWHLVEAEGAEAPPGTTLDLSEPGRISGQAPCNRYEAPISGSYPGFETGGIVTTRMACPDLPLETRYIAALDGATRAELVDGRLVISDGAGAAMVYVRADP
ncbi:META domain-containing protein [Rhodobacterales bacterium HKCCE2091]|nr:META domain-containing protein [Rhodobacterales bacterium HKCCE2091]